MANNLKQPVEVSPGVRDTNEDGTPDTNEPAAAFGTTKGTDWVSEWFSVDSVEHGAEEVSIMVHVDWAGGSQVDLLPQFQHREAAMPQDPRGLVREQEALPIVEFDGARLNASFEAEQDVITLLQANFRTDPGTQEFAFQVQGVSQVRFLARNPAAGNPILRMQLLSGGGWRGA